MTASDCYEPMPFSFLRLSCDSLKTSVDWGHRGLDWPFDVDEQYGSEQNKKGGGRFGMKEPIFDIHLSSFDIGAFILVLLSYVMVAFLAFWDEMV